MTVLGAAWAAGCAWEAEDWEAVADCDVFFVAPEEDEDDLVEDFAAGFSAVSVVAAFLPIDSFRPGWISDGSVPTAVRLSWYSFCQPPLTFWSSAIFER